MRFVAGVSSQPRTTLATLLGLIQDGFKKTDSSGKRISLAPLCATGCDRLLLFIENSHFSLRNRSEAGIDVTIQLYGA